MVVAPDEEYRLAAVRRVVKHVYYQVSVDGLAPCVPPIGAVGIAVQGEVGDDEYRLVVIRILQITGQGFRLRGGVVIHLVGEIVGAKAVDAVLVPLRPLGILHVPCLERAGAGAEIAVLELMIAGGVERGDGKRIDGVEYGLRAGPERVAVKVRVGHIAAEAQQLEIAPEALHDVYPAYHAVDGDIVREVMHVGGEGKHGGLRAASIGAIRADGERRKEQHQRDGQ